MSDSCSYRLTAANLTGPGATAAMLAFAGLPLYIHLPNYYAVEMEVELAVLGAVLLAARAFDSLQDPLIGRLADRWSHSRELWARVAGGLLVVGFLLLFAPPSWGEPLPRLIIGLLVAFSGFSALQIALYDHGLAQATKAGGGYTRIALWREVGGLAGICLAAAVPAVMVTIYGASLGYSGYAIFFTGFVVVVLMLMRGKWLASEESSVGVGFQEALRAPGVIPVLLFGLINALPTAVTSTLFFFFVDDILVAREQAGPILLVFFAAAATAAPAWARLADRIGRKATLAIGMSVSIPAFIGVVTLGSGDIIAFYAIVVASGVAIGADMILVPAMLAVKIRGGGARVFSAWTFLQKMALAVAAGTAFPLLALVGYEPGTLEESGLLALTLTYALVPCALKLVALVVLFTIVDEIGEQT